MTNRYGDEDEPGRWQGAERGDRGRRLDEGEVGKPDRPRRRGREPEFGVRPGGGYGMGGVERGYNQGGYGGLGSYEQGYTPGSYDRKLGATERYDRDEDEEYDGRLSEESSEARPVSFGREPWGDEWMSFESPSRRENLRGGHMEWTARAQGPGKAPKGYTRSDERIREDICERLMTSPYDASDVEITVSRGEVTLTGTVHSRADKWGIEDVAEAILGVQDVHNQIRMNRGEAQTSGTILGGDTGHVHS
ncbi:BON domain-containing protein [Hyalangium sp.]|uniref:BON domain-containing protein n=1 Tax=Hyalangium sp. TaxID=2028555 RepID=UPI002D629BB8|nr:BON domain-containing protein [Hyalangium sp.]HYH97906.1 BON domain-containing protein [Hyalangium sp.]